MFERCIRLRESQQRHIHICTTKDGLGGKIRALGSIAGL